MRTGFVCESVLRCTLCLSFASGLGLVVVETLRASTTAHESYGLWPDSV
jgi:hypothetical protein